MKLNLLYLVVGFIFLICRATECRKYSNCTDYKQDSFLLTPLVENSSAVYHLYDTIWISSSVSDNIVPLSGSGSFTFSFLQLYLNAQPYSVNTTNSLPELEYANIEFNPVVIDGLLENTSYLGYNFLYKRNGTMNTLKFGFVAGRTGLYVISFNNSTYFGGGGLTIAKPGDECTTYNGLSSFPIDQQNQDYWNNLGVTAISLSSNSGSGIISKDMKNYVFFRVDP